MYKGDALALEVFADPWFYDDEPEVATFREERRTKLFTPTTTIREVRQQYQHQDVQNGFTTLGNRIGGNTDRVNEYFATVGLPVEELLAGEGIVGLLDGSREVKIFQSRHVAGGVPTTRAVFAGSRAGDREQPLCFVLGPSGSGKTFFALEHLRNFRKKKDKDNDKLKSVALYVQPAGFVGDPDSPGFIAADNAAATAYVDFASPGAPQQLGICVRNQLDAHIRRHHPDAGWEPHSSSRRRRLGMHVCFIFDEAGSGSLLGFFEDQGKVLALVSWLESARIATSIAVVATGTGLIATSFDSAKHAYFFRMKPWGRSDLTEVVRRCLENEADRVDLEPEAETAEDVTDAVYSLPLLQGLATNGRSCYLLVRSVALTQRRTPNLNAVLGWREHLRSTLPAIVDEVVSEYVSSNGISYLPASDRPRVAAWVFGALSRLEKGKTHLPELDGLNKQERQRAMLLLQLNVQKEGSSLTLLPGQHFSATLTPATTIVLFNMAGVLTGILSGWRGEEEVAALYAAHKGILDRWSKHAQEVNTLQKEHATGRDDMTLAQFDQTLASTGKEHVHRNKLHELSETFAAKLKELRVYRLQLQYQSPKRAAIFIPAVAKDSIIVNADKASYADVIAYRMLLQAKHTVTTQKPVKVDLVDEMRKCGLLKEGGHDRALRGLLLLWNGKLTRQGAQHTGEIATRPGPLSAPIDVSRLQESKAFPVNMIKSHRPQEFVLYHKVDKNDIVEALDNTRLPERPEQLDITFILCTNALKLELNVTPRGSRTGDCKSRQEAGKPQAQRRTPSVEAQSEDGTMVGPPREPEANAKNARSKPEEKSDIVSVAEESLGPDMGIDLIRLADEGEKKAWEGFCNAVVEGVKIQFLFTRGA
jgi:hypothetical protein